MQARLSRSWSSLPPWTTSRRGGRDFCFSTSAALCGASTMLTGSLGGHARDHWVLPAIRAITHVEGKAMRSSRRVRRGAGCWLRTPVAPPGWRRYRAARLRGGRRRRPVVLSQDARPRMGVPVGEGSARRRLRRQETVDRGPGLRPLSPAVAVVRTRRDGALACRPGRASGTTVRTRSQPGRKRECSYRRQAALCRPRAPLLPLPDRKSSLRLPRLPPRA
jgi:hypothetical protein